MQTVSSVGSPSSEDREYKDLLDQLRDTFVESPVGALFTTDATDLFGNFLDGIPVGRRKHYTCKACRRFVERFGGLVTIDESGNTRSPFWLDSLPFFADGIRSMGHLVSKARVTGVFLSDESVWGLPSNRSAKAPHHDGAWHHMHAVPAPSMVRRKHPIVTTEMAMAEKLEDYGILCRGLAEFSIDTVRQAHTLLTTGALVRSEKCIGVAKWLLDLHAAREATKNQRQLENLVWLAVAGAPPGYCHVRSTMIATLLEDIVAGKPFEAIKRSFDAKMSPILYQRPQAAPTDGQLAAAEAVVAKLASAGSLERRFATFEDVASHAIWLPKVKGDPPVEGVFGHLKSKKETSAIEVPAQNITWEKFARTILPSADRVEMLMPDWRTNFFAFVTAVNAEAPPILQWDSESHRNPVSWYVYHGGSLAIAWGLTSGQFVDVTAITMQPSGWHGPSAHQGDGAYFILRGARDIGWEGGSLALFPETLRNEYREIRSAIEAYSRSRRLVGFENSTACGLVMKTGVHPWNEVVRVTSAGSRLSWRLDRWD
jgi:hypothetical protein